MVGDDRGPEPDEFGLRDLLHTHLDARRQREVDPKASDWYEAQAMAASRAFQIDLEKPPFDHDGLRELLGATLDALAQLHNLRSPFEGYLEAPMSIIQLHQRYSEWIGDAGREFRNVLMNLAVDIVARLWRIYPDTTVSWDELAAHGFLRATPTLDPFDD